MLTTFFCTGPTRGGTYLAVFMVVLFALLGAPLAHIGAEPTVFGRKFAIGNHHFNTDQAGLDTLHAAIWAIVITFFTGHLRQTVLAIHPTLLAGLDTTFIIRYHFFVSGFIKVL